MNRKLRLLDLFCGAGGAAAGYVLAGFEVVGVDNKPQPNYPFEFHQADALTYDLDGFDAVHASPPCQAYSVTRFSHGHKHPKLIRRVRDRLHEARIPYVIENVVGAPLLSPMMLCGTMFGLSAYDSPDSPFAKKNSPRPCLFLARHRLFETSFPCDAFSRCDCAGFRRAGAICAGVYGGGRSLRKGNRGGYTPNVNVRRELMQCDWMSGKELSQAIPPAYTAYIGRKLYQSASGGVI